MSGGWLWLARCENLGFWRNGCPSFLCLLSIKKNNVISKSHLSQEVKFLSKAKKMVDEIQDLFPQCLSCLISKLENSIADTGLFHFMLPY